MAKLPTFPDAELTVYLPEEVDGMSMFSISLSPAQLQTIKVALGFDDDFNIPNSYANSFLAQCVIPSIESGIQEFEVMHESWEPGRAYAKTQRHESMFE